ncbi:hypothetical protein SAMN04488057_113102 [Cyclobacterium lianum]|uniref:Two component regulator propeller n=1 Tax=Cyclobacterium lianum TaxID=388280 RepID=A0A1M7Q3V7_9BACT|nr:hypothetical protein [Cyclobacterium lianum]SHN24786.1 hypothetical protein SAMN04488057_113102 [Cyclobacterium lianum]
MKQLQFTFLLFLGFVFGFTQLKAQKLPVSSAKKHLDLPFIQEFAVRYSPEEQQQFVKAFADRNGTVQVLSRDGLYRPHAGDFLYPGELIPDRTYLPMKDKAVSSMTLVDGQFVYLDEKAVFSNAWAGSLYLAHALPAASIFAHGEDFNFLVSDGSALQLIGEEGSLWQGKLDGSEILDIKYDRHRKVFYLLSANEVLVFSPGQKSLEKMFSENKLTCFELRSGKDRLAIGTREGFFEWDLNTRQRIGEKNTSLPWPDLTAIKEINGLLWFGSEMGAFMLREDGKFNYYYGERWLPAERVIQISQKNEDEILLLTDQGLGTLVFDTYTLAEKAAIYDRQVRERHIRHGFNASLVGMEKGNVNSGRLGDSDNDGLWTSMYLAGEAFRYAVTGSADALQHVRESLDAMERLYTINPVAGFPSRSFERSGYIERLSDPERWQHAEDPEWDWKATTSSDEAIGHVFVFGVIAELVEDETIRHKAVRLLDELMQHIVDNDWYLVDYDGKPTTWGRWHPDYVNSFPTMVGDRKLNSSNIVAMLQTAYHFTGKEMYKEKAYELMENHGYLENLMRPMEEIGRAKEGSDEWAAMLSQSWNHSDDEMYFLGYWGLYRYAFTDELKEKYKAAIVDHWEAERPEKDGLWNIFTAMVSPENFDLEEAIWYLEEYPLDLINWTVKNSHRKDIELIEENFRRQTTREVLPPDELQIRRHNANRFGLDGGRDGTQESSAGDIWLLPYWMGRYLDAISSPLE